ncbi:unnamed protein product [marine sediment metagenome]|uniref:Uncharacterized protein n=1 Tax=marine sediment metagenome TaxID=412755 RepID=X1S6K3_9ZZZZ
MSELPVGGLSGIAQGGILEALKRPIYSKTVETFKYGRKGSGNEGKLLERTVIKKQFSVGDAVVIILVGGIVYIAADASIRKWILDALDPLDIIGDADLSVVAEVVKDAMDPFGLFDFTTEEKNSIIDVFKGAVDPFGIFD